MRPSSRPGSVGSSMGDPQQRTGSAGGQGQVDELRFSKCRTWLAQEGWKPKPQRDEEIKDIMVDVMRRIEDRSGQNASTPSDKIANDDPLQPLRPPPSETSSRAVRRLLGNRIPGVVLRPAIGVPLQRAFDTALDLADIQNQQLCGLEKSMESASQRIYDLEMDKGEDDERALECVIEEELDRQEVIDRKIKKLFAAIRVAKSSAALGLKESRNQAEAFMKEIADIKNTVKEGRKENIKERIAMDMVGGRLLELKLALDSNAAGDEELLQSFNRIKEFVARQKKPPVKKKKKKKVKGPSAEDEAHIFAFKEKIRRLKELEAQFEAKSKSQADMIEKNSRALADQEKKINLVSEVSLLGAQKSEELASALKSRLGFGAFAPSEIKQMYVKKRRASMKPAGGPGGPPLVAKRRESRESRENEVGGVEVAQTLPVLQTKEEEASSPAVGDTTMKGNAPTDSTPPKETLENAAEDDQEYGVWEDDLSIEDVDEHMMLAMIPLGNGDGGGDGDDDDEDAAETRRLQEELRRHNEEQAVQRQVIAAARDQLNKKRRQSMVQSDKVRAQLENDKARIAKARRQSQSASAFLVEHNLANPKELEMAEANSRGNTPDGMQLQALSPPKNYVSAEGVNPDGTWDPENPPPFLVSMLELLREAETHQREERIKSQAVDDLVHKLAAQCQEVAEQGRGFDDALDALESAVQKLEEHKADASQLEDVAARLASLESTRNERNAEGVISIAEVSVRLPSLERAMADLRVRSVLEQQVQVLWSSKSDANVLTAQLAGLSASVRTLVDDARQQDRLGIDRAVRTIAARQDSATNAFDSFAASFDASSSRLGERVRSVLSEAAAPKLIRKLRTETANAVEAAVAAQAEKLARQGKSLVGLQDNLHRVPDERVVRRIVAVCMDKALKAKDKEVAKVSGLLHQLREEQQGALTRDEALVLATARVDQIFDSELVLRPALPAGSSSSSGSGSSHGRRSFTPQGTGFLEGGANASLLTTNEDDTAESQ